MNPYLASFLAISLDYGSTKYALSQGAVESNPIVVSQFEAIKIAEIALVGYGIHLINKKNKKAARMVKIGLFMVNGMFAIHNVRQGLRAK